MDGAVAEICFSGKHTIADADVVIAVDLRVASQIDVSSGLEHSSFLNGDAGIGTNTQKTAHLPCSQNVQFCFAGSGSVVLVFRVDDDSVPRRVLRKNNLSPKRQLQWAMDFNGQTHQSSPATGVVVEAQGRRPVCS